jgi:hypothetical protein
MSTNPARQLAEDDDPAKGYGAALSLAAIEKRNGHTQKQ